MKNLKYFLMLFVAAVMISSCSEEDPIEEVPTFSVLNSEKGSTFTMYDPSAIASLVQDVDSNLFEISGGAFVGGVDPETGAGIVKFLEAVDYTITHSTYSGDPAVLTEASEQTITVEAFDISSLEGVSITEAESTDGMFWYTPSYPPGAAPYIRLLVNIAGQDNPDLLKLYIYTEVGADLAGTYTWGGDKAAGTYDLGYTADYAGMTYKYTGSGTDGSGDLTVTQSGDTYTISGSLKLSYGNYDGNWEFVEGGTVSFDLDYTGGITE